MNLKHKSLIFTLIVMLLAITSIAAAQAQNRNTGIVSSIVEAPIVADGTLTGVFPDFVINFDTSMDPAVPGRTLKEGKQIRITMPDDFTVNGPAEAGDAFAAFPFDIYSWGALLQGWPQVPIFSTFPPADLTGDIRYTNSMSGTHTLVITADQDIDGNLHFPGPGIKQIHVLFAHLVNPAPGSYDVLVEAETGPNGELEIGTGTIEIKATQAPKINFTSIFNGDGRPNAIYQTVAVGDFLEIPYHLLAWGDGGEPLSGAQVWQNGPDTADIVVFDMDGNPIDVGDVTITAPSPTFDMGIGTIEIATEDINAPISGRPTAHMVVEFIAGSTLGPHTVEFSMDGGNTIQAFVNVVPRDTDTPGTRTWHGMTIDPTTNDIYLSGGRSHGCFCVRFKDLWRYEPASDEWKRLGDFANQLPATDFDMSAFDTESGVLILNAGDGSADMQTYIFTPSTGDFELSMSTSKPESRFEPMMVYHPIADKTVMFGGVKTADFDTLADTWLYDANTDEWEEVTPTGTPAQRGRFAMVYDSAANKIIMYGGGTSSLFSGLLLDDTWEYDIDANTWSEITTMGAPSLVEQVTGAYDTESDKFIVYGLSTGGDYETWAFDYPTSTWTKVHTSDRNAIGPKMHHVGEMVYSAADDRAYIYGGAINWYEGPRASDELWAFDYNSSSWMQVADPTAIELAETGIASPTNNGALLAAFIAVTALTGAAVVRRRLVFRGL